MRRWDRTMPCDSASTRLRNTSIHFSKRINTCARNIDVYTVITAFSRSKIKVLGMRWILAKREDLTRPQKEGRRYTMRWVPKSLSSQPSLVLSHSNKKTTIDFNWNFVTLTRRLPTALNFCPRHRNEYPRKWRHSMRVRIPFETEYRTRMYKYRPHQHLRRPKSSYIHSITVRIPLTLWLFYRFRSNFAYILVQFTNSF